MRTLGDDDLLELLGHTLMTDPAVPDDAERAALRRALADTSSGATRAGVGLQVLRRPIAAGVAAAILLSGGAAAAVETNALPGPLRSIASSLGLPVSPTPLEQAQNAVADLSRALSAGDPAATRAALSSLLAALPELSQTDRAQLGPMVAELIADAEIFLANKTTGLSRPDSASRGARIPGDTSGSDRNSSDANENPSGDGDPETPSTATSGPVPTGDTSQSDGGTSGGSAPTSGGGDGGGSGGGGDGGSGTSGTSGSTTSGGTTSSDGGSGSSTSGSDGSGGTNTLNANNTSGSDGSGGSDGGISGSDDAGTLDLPH